MWGSDWPVLNLNGSYERWLAAAQKLVPANQQAQVFSKTAKAFYRI
jgi:L-fuconolactonase